MIDWRPLLSSDPQICGGSLCARGTRVHVTNILDSLAEGAGRREILRSDPTLSAHHIDAALAYAAELAHEESLLPQTSSAHRPAAASRRWSLPEGTCQPC